MLSTDLKSFLTGQSDTDVMLSTYLKSFIPGLWDTDAILPKEWTDWLSILKKNRYISPVSFKATNKYEYAKAIKPYLPYLNDTDPEILYDKLMTAPRCYFAGPPLLIGNFFLLMETGKAWDQKNNLCYYLEFTTMNIPSKLESYAETPFIDKSLAYAQSHWGHILRNHPRIPTRTYVFADPSSKIVRRCGGAPRMYEIYVGWDGVIQGPPTPDTKHFMTSEKILFEEISRSNYPPPEFCVYDGSALDINRCNICNRSFPKKEYGGGYSGYPIHNTVLDYLKENESRIRSYYKISTDEQIIPNKQLWEKAQLNYYV